MVAVKSTQQVSAHRYGGLTRWADAGLIVLLPTSVTKTFEQMFHATALIIGCVWWSMMHFYIHKSHFPVYFSLLWGLDPPLGGRRVHQEEEAPGRLLFHHAFKHIDITFTIRVLSFAFEQMKYRFHRSKSGWFLINKRYKNTQSVAWPLLSMMDLFPLNPPAP